MRRLQSGGSRLDARPVAKRLARRSIYTRPPARRLPKGPDARRVARRLVRRSIYTRPPAWWLPVLALCEDVDRTDRQDRTYSPPYQWLAGVRTHALCGGVDRTEHEVPAYCPRAKAHRGPDEARGVRRVGRTDPQPALRSSRFRLLPSPFPLGFA